MTIKFINMTVQPLLTTASSTVTTQLMYMYNTQQKSKLFWYKVHCHLSNGNMRHLKLIILDK